MRKASFRDGECDYCNEFDNCEAPLIRQILDELAQKLNLAAHPGFYKLPSPRRRRTKNSASKLPAASGKRVVRLATGKTNVGGRSDTHALITSSTPISISFGVTPAQRAAVRVVIASES